ncbi:PLP-dependent aminotransferase family protein [Salegentibacter mishustinae]|uniref:MocR-like pyridoxine biosynthesis transcription factor PdxR n=1 Tax=Salegentibacter mishustinae TaxID=270918 RepID=UPI0024919FFC|nr:PLP-dependent aminotransferase family protein [Salegentibacter mishustinae]
MRYNFRSILKFHGFDPNKDDLLYHNLYKSLKTAILKRSLPPESKLPPTRILAKDLGISRSTVLKAYEILTLENFIESIIGSGYYVRSPKEKKLNLSFELQRKEGKHPEISNRAQSFLENGSSNIQKSSKSIAFKPGMPPVDIFPIQIWSKLIGDYWKDVRPSHLSFSHPNGDLDLRRNLANYLKIHRNIDCSPNQILITSGTVHSLYLATNILINPEDEILLENPTFPKASQLFKSLEAKLIPTGIDEEGMKIPKELNGKPKLIYTTPSNQYPTGVKMTIARRVELLKWASKKGSIIIEDDYDQEFSNWKDPIASLYSLDKQQRVIYLGNFNKVTHPSMRLGYMIVPPYLLKALSILHNHSSRFLSVATQKGMSSFIEKDFLSLHLRNLIQVVDERKDIFLEEFYKRFQDHFELQTHNPIGLHLIAKSSNKIPDILLEKVFAKSNIKTGALSNHYVGDNKTNGTIFGHAACNPLQIRKHLDRMQTLLKDM